MPRKKKPESTALAIVSRPDLPQPKRTRNGGERILGTTRAAFLRAYEAYGGNVTKACQIVGINRRTYYRWLDSPTRVNEKFKKRLKAIRPDDIIVDAAELAISSAISDGDVTAAIFTLKTKGRSRGWNEKVDTTVMVNSEVLDKVAFAYSLWLADHPHATIEEKMHWLGKFAENGKVEKKALAEKVGLGEK